MNLNRLIIIAIYLFFVSLSSSFAQSNLRGAVIDLGGKEKLFKAAVVLLNQKDSVLINFNRTKEDGTFLLSNVDTGAYKLIISYPEYADYVDDIVLTAEDMDFGVLGLSKAALLLDEVEVVGRIPVVIRGDTIEYDAGSFAVEKDAKVEDLLKVLPGITMDATGKITAQGKEVKKVLLDGEEFFGDDPTLITKNIRSDMVNKVQVYEKKSDLAERTGIDDGERTQTIDILLKEDKKKGMFGEVQGGVGTDHYYSGKAMVNRFRGAQRIAAYGITANDGLVGLGFQNNQKYGIESNSGISISDGGGIVISISGGGDGTDSFTGMYGGGGIPKALNMGASYSDKSADDKHKINVNYKRNQMDVENTTTYAAQNNLPEIARLDNSVSNTNNDTKSNIANLRYDYKLDSLSDLTLKLGYNKSDRENRSVGNSDQRELDGTLIYEGDNKNNQISSTESVNADILLTRRFRKARRSLTLNANVASNDNKSDALFYSSTKYINDGNTETIDQLKNNKSNGMNLRTSLNYSEPISKNISLSAGYNINIDKGKTLDQSFDKDENTGLYDILDESVLNDYDLSTIRNGITTGLNFNYEKVTFNLSNQMDFEDVKRVYNNLEQTLQRNQVSTRPSLSVNYKISNSESINIRYNGSTLQPSLTQIEPLKQNEQQLIEYIGNPDLKSGFRNSISLNYNLYKALQKKNLYMYASASQSMNSVNNKVEIDPQTGKQRVSYVNMDKNNWNGNIGMGYRMPLIKKIALDMNLGLNGNYSNNYNYLSLGSAEAQLNNTQNFVFSPSVGFSRYQANKLDFNVELGPGLRVMKSLVQPDFNSTSFALSSSGNVTYYMPKDFKINLNVRQSYQGATETLSSYNQVNMNTYVSKKFLKDKSLEAQIFVNDVLNRNNGISRQQSGYLFSQTSNDVLRRYAMFKLIYNFTTMKGGN